jgi:hypothetical protein
MGLVINIVLQFQVIKSFRQVRYVTALKDMKLPTQAFIVLTVEVKWYRRTHERNIQTS